MSCTDLRKCFFVWWDKGHALIEVAYDESYVHVLGGSGRDVITVNGCVSTDGVMLPPYVITVNGCVSTDGVMLPPYVITVNGCVSTDGVMLPPYVITVNGCVSTDGVMLPPYVITVNGCVSTDGVMLPPYVITVNGCVSTDGVMLPPYVITVNGCVSTDGVMLPPYVITVNGCVSTDGVMLPPYVITVNGCVSTDGVMLPPYVITVNGCVSTDGVMLPPYVIYAAKNLWEAWMQTDHKVSDTMSATKAGSTLPAFSTGLTNCSFHPFLQTDLFSSVWMGASPTSLYLYSVATDQPPAQHRLHSVWRQLLLLSTGGWLAHTSWHKLCWHCDEESKTQRASSHMCVYLCFGGVGRGVPFSNRIQISRTMCPMYLLESFSPSEKKIEKIAKLTHGKCCVGCLCSILSLLSADHALEDHHDYIVSFWDQSTCRILLSNEDEVMESLSAKSGVEIDLNSIEGLYMYGNFSSWQPDLENDRL